MDNQFLQNLALSQNILYITSCFYQFLESILTVRKSLLFFKFELFTFLKPGCGPLCGHNLKICGQGAIYNYNVLYFIANYRTSVSTVLAFENIEIVQHHFIRNVPSFNRLTAFKQILYQKLNGRVFLYKLKYGFENVGPEKPHYHFREGIVAET